MFAQTNNFKLEFLMERFELIYQPILVVADIHGNFDIFEKEIKNKDIRNCVIIVAGDCGFGFYKEIYYERVFSSMNNKFIERNIHCFMIRGNHDDPSYFNEPKINYSNIKTIKDYTIITVGNKNILCVGGAISIDRRMRIHNYWSRIEHYSITMNVTEAEARSKFLPSYWENEMPIYDEEKLNDIKNNSINIDYVITHTSPHFCFKSDKNGIEYWLKNDETLEDDLKIERRNLSLLYDKLINDNNVIKKWVYGHFHEHNDEIINGIEFTALVNCDYNFDFKELNAYEF